MSAWPPPPAPPSPSRRPPLPPGAPVALIFEFWNDRCYQPYQPEDLQILNAKFREKPRPQQVVLAGGRYVLQNFGQVEEGFCVQVNLRTQFERSVRLKPPYRLPGYPEAKLPDGPFHFQFEDEHSWRPYSAWLQRELEQVVRCAPPPGQFYFSEDGKGYILRGLDTLAGPTPPELFQLNSRTHNVRRVALMPGPPPAVAPPSHGFAAPQAPPSHGNAAPQPPVARGSSLLGRLVGGGGGSFGAASSSAGSRSRPGSAQGSWSSNGSSFMLSSAIFQVNPGTRMTCGGPHEKVQAVSPEVHEALCNAWRGDPRPEQVKLPAGDFVTNFQDLEVGGAVLHHAASSSSSSSHHLGPIPLPSMHRHRNSGPSQAFLEVHLPMPSPGIVVLPNELDVEDGRGPSAFGRFLSNAEVAQLPSRGEEANKCSICLSEMEPDGDPSDPDIAMASDNSLGDQGAEGPAFELQCGHAYHTDCIAQWFKQRRRCPQCQKDLGKVVGDQPRTGKLFWHLEPHALPGHGDTKETIVIQFEFPSGTTEQGTQYDGRKPRGYLPGNAQGVILLELFKIAFRRCVMFGIGNSMTFGNVRPTFNIHIKTSTHRGTAGHGYPDDNYFKRAMEELRANGVTMADLPK